MHSICSRSSSAWRNASSIMMSGAFASAPDSMISLSSSLRATATLRCEEENSSAKIFIRNAPLVLIEDFNCDFAEILRWKFVIRHSLRPFNDRDTIRFQVFFQSGSENLLRRFEPVQIEMKECEPSAGVNVHKREARRMNPRSNFQTAGDAFDQLRLARAEVSGQGDHEPRLRSTAPAFAE